VGAAFLVLVLSWAGRASDDAGTQAFNLPADDAEPALRKFAQQSGREVIFPTDLVKGVRTNPVHGVFRSQKALERMLAGTPLRASQDEATGALAIVRVSASAVRSAANPLSTDTQPTSPQARKNEMNKSRTLLAALAALFTVAGHAQVAPQDAAASATNEETVKLPAFSVSASKWVDPYRAADVMSVARIAGSILDSPMSVNAVTPQLIQDIGANAAFDVTRYLSGISPGRGTGAGGIMDRQDFRGFESFSKTIDDFSSFLIPTGQGFQANFNPAFVDHAELVMGPDSILSPTGTPGGSVNVITKSPSFTRGADLSAEVGNYNAGKITFDSTGPLGDGKHMAYRVIADYQDAQTYVPGDIRMWAASAQLVYKFSDTAKLTVKYFGEQWGLKGAIANPNDNGEMISGPDTVGGATLSKTPQAGFTYDGWNGDATWAHRWDRFNIVAAELTAALSDRINMRLGAEILYDAFTQDAAYPSTNPTETWNPNTGQEIGVVALIPSAISEIANFNHAMNREIQLQNDFAGNFNMGGVSLQPVVGWAYQQGSQPVEYQIQDKNTADLPPANLAVGYYNPPHPPMANYTSFSANTPERGWLYQVYGLIRAGLLDNRLYLTGGGARTWANVNDYKFSGIYLPGIGQIGSTAAPAEYTFSNTGVAAAPTQRNTHDTYLAGILGKPLPNVSIYYSFSTNAGIAQNSPVWQAGKQHEFGVKSEFFNQRLSFTAAHFQITENNVSSVNPLFNTGQSTIANILANETNHGVEFDVVGGLTKELSVILSYTNMHLRDSAGRRVRNVPDNMGNLLLSYHFSQGALQNASVFVGIVHVGNVAGENSPNLGYTPSGVPDQVGFYVDGWTAVNAGASYRWGRYRFNLNVDNVLDEKFWWQPASRQSVSPYPGLTVRFTTTMHF
jgi:outer membrane receptor protein involved in Fe transport